MKHPELFDEITEDIHSLRDKLMEDLPFFEESQRSLLSEALDEVRYALRNMYVAVQQDGD